jgi:hypothetical protein
VAVLQRDPGNAGNIEERTEALERNGALGVVRIGGTACPDYTDLLAGEMLEAARDIFPLAAGARA